MNLQHNYSIVLNKDDRSKKHAPTETSVESGFTLIETTIALVTLGVCLAYALPLFLYAKINNSKSEIRTGALIVAQRTFDNIRSKPFSSNPPNPVTDLPQNDGINSANPGVNPISIPVTASSPTAAEKLLTYAMGRQYQTTVTYCGGVNLTPSICSNKYRSFLVEVNFNGSKVYDLQGTYTQFD